jgi:hypothetical protein
MLLTERRKCAEPGCEIHFIPKSSRNRYCLRHRRRKPRDPMHDLKYGTVHRQTRAVWRSRVARGDVILPEVWGPIRPGEPWDLDHRDDGRAYLGPSHSRCNRRTNRGREPALWDATSRIW